MRTRLKSTKSRSVHEPDARLPAVRTFAKSARIEIDVYSSTYALPSEKPNHGQKKQLDWPLLCCSSEFFAVARIRLFQSKISDKKGERGKDLFFKEFKVRAPVHFLCEPWFEFFSICWSFRYVKVERLTWRNHSKCSNKLAGERYSRCLQHSLH